MQEGVFFVNNRGEKLSGTVHGKGAKAVILCHGFRSSKENNAAWAEKLSDSFAVLRFDFSGHGESDGELKDITLTRLLADMSAAIGFIASRGAKSIGLAGHSLGGIAFHPCVSPRKGDMFSGRCNGLFPSKLEQVRAA